METLLIAQVHVHAFVEFSVQKDALGQLALKVLLGRVQDLGQDFIGLLLVIAQVLHLVVEHLSEVLLAIVRCLLVHWETASPSSEVLLTLCNRCQ